MVKVERIPKKASAAAKAKASKASTPKAAKPEGSCKIEVLPEATSRKAASRKPEVKSEGKAASSKAKVKSAAEEPYPDWAAPSREAAVEATAALSLAHGDVEHKKATEQRKSILDSLVRTILSQNTTDKTSLVAFERLKAGLPTWSEVLAAPAGVAEELVRCGGLAEVKMERVRAILADPRVAGRGAAGEPCLEWLHGERDDAAVKRTLSSFKGVGPKTVSCVMMFTMGRAEFPVDTHVLHIAKMCKWLPEAATREKAYEHLNRRVPDEVKFALHVLLVEHGKCCTRCAKNGKLQKKECALAGPCPLLDLSCR